MYKLMVDYYTSRSISAKCSRKMNVIAAVNGSIIPVKVLVN